MRRLTFLFFLLTSCQLPPDQPADWSCSFQGVTPAGSTSAEANITMTFRLSAQTDFLWPTEWRKIPVCWEDQTFVPAQEIQRSWVKDSVLGQWGATLAVLEDGTPVPHDRRYEFVHWGKCSELGPERFHAITLKVADARPNSAVGIQGAGTPGFVSLNFTYSRWNSVCGESRHLESCIRASAVHEFGHALGFVHEQSRSDTPSDCRERWEMEDAGNFYGGRWDGSSLLNYCNPEWNNGGILSPNDRRWARFLYYPDLHPNVFCELRE